MTIQEHIKIERLRALKRMCEWIEENESGYEALTLKRYGIELLSNLAAIDCPTGKWHECGPCLLVCSKCKKVIGAPITNAPAYCENCGAKMNGDEVPDEADAELEAQKQFTFKLSPREREIQNQLGGAEDGRRIQADFDNDGREDPQ